MEGNTNNDAETNKIITVDGLSTINLVCSGPYFEDNNYGGAFSNFRENIPDTHGVYFGFTFDKGMATSGVPFFTSLTYVGRAIGTDTLNKRIGDHYRDYDLTYRDTKTPVDMSSIGFFVCEMNDEDEIKDVEAALINGLKPPANDIGVDNYIGKIQPLMVFCNDVFNKASVNVLNQVVTIK